MLDITRAFGLTFICPAKDSTVSWSLRSSGEFARPEQDLLASLLGPHKTPGAMVDVGANLGAISLPLAKRYPAWRFLGIEAQRGMSGLYAANAVNNFLPNVEWLHAAAGAAEGLVDFPVVSLSAMANLGDVGLSREGPTEKVRTVRLDHVAPANTKLIKIDVQGAEMDVLIGAEDLLSRADLALLVEAERSGTRASEATAANVDHLRARGYRTFAFFSPFVTRRRDKFSESEVTAKGDFSIVAIRPGVPLIWDLPEVLGGDQPWPTDPSQYAYLKHYGLEPPK